MRQRKPACLDREMECLSIEQLDELLQKELQKERPDENVVLPILHALRHKELDHPVIVENKDTGAWEEYQKHIIATDRPTRGNWRRRLPKVIAAAAAAAVIVCAIPFVGQANGALDILYRITDSFVEFFRPGGGNTNSAGVYVFETDHPGLQQVYDAVVELGVTDSVVPMWLPEGYVLAELEELPAPGGVRLCAKFIKEEKSIFIQYKIAADASLSLYEKKDGVTFYEVNDQKHLIYENVNNCGAVWALEDVECMISAELETDDLYKMITSIYRRK